MPRIAGVDIPNDKRTLISLQYIYGIGPHHAKAILKEAGIGEDVRAKNLTEDETSRIAAVCRFEASAPGRTPEPERVRARPSPARRA